MVDPVDCYDYLSHRYHVISCVLYFPRALFVFFVCSSEDGKIKISKFDGHDFRFWKMQIEDYLYQKKLHQPLAEAKPTGMKAEDETLGEAKPIGMKAED
nr:retrovirus-related Pol polyprotein from transposon TNT 1-94 [Tanacetum cinerariifolium]